jgi:hypothetical protein
MSISEDVLEPTDHRQAEGSLPADFREFEPRNGAVLRRELAPLAVCVAIGLAMALLPPLVRWIKTGHPIWIGNGDELFMLALGSGGYFNHPGYLTDPVLVSGGTSLFRQLPLLPGVWVATALSLGTVGIDNCWRILAGVSLAVTWYGLIRQFVKSRWIAAGLAIILLSDSGLLGAGILFRQTQAFYRLLHSSPNLFSGEFLHPEWRVATPALTMAYLLLHLWLVMHARGKPRPVAVTLSGLSFALLFHVYPYFWTAATAALVLAFLIDRGHREVYLGTALVGVPLGSLRIYWDLDLKRSTAADWLIRSDKFVQVSRFTDLKPPIVATLVVLVGLIWVWQKRRDALYLWTMALAGLVLFKSHLITGRDIENYHWYYVWGPCCSLLLLLMAVSAVQHDGSGAGLAHLVVIAIALADAATGLCLRVAEALKAPAALILVEKCVEYQAQRIESDVPQLTPRATAAGDHHFMNFATILENQRPLDNYWVFLSPQVTDAEWYQRSALNGYLLGQDRAGFEAEKRATFLTTTGQGWGPWKRDLADGQRRFQSLLDAYDTTVENPLPVLDRFGVRYVGLPASRDPPNYLLREHWIRLQDGPFWQVWERPTRATR